MKKNIQKDTQMMAVIKMDGYGHGAVQIAKLLEPKDYIWGYAVATLDEAILLKDACLKKPVLVLGCIFPDQWDTMIRNEVRMTVYSYEMAKEVSELAEAMGCKVYVHIKLDTGMARLGFQITEENAEEIAKISKLPNLVMEGMFTHFSKSDEADKTFEQSYISEELDKLVDSGSFSETHIQISKLSKYADKFDKNQILKFLNGYYRNPQINWISTDNDVKDFLRLIQNNQHYSIELRKSAREQLDDEIDLTEEPLAT